MKIFALNASPRKGKGNTERILQPFLEGAREAGAETEVVYLHGKKINPCLGCYKCWFKSPGVCVQKDDAAALIERWRAADIVVYATPLYVFGMAAQLKLFFDRIIPEALPFIEVQDNYCSHPFRHEKKTSGMVLISNCGFHGLDNFKELVAHFKVIALHMEVDYLGALLRPEGEFLLFAEKLMPDAAQEVYTAAREAGKQLVKEGKIADEILKRVSREILPLDQFVEGANTYFKQLIAEADQKDN